MLIFGDKDGVDQFQGEGLGLKVQIFLSLQRGYLPTHPGGAEMHLLPLTY